MLESFASRATSMDSRRSVDAECAHDSDTVYDEKNLPGFHCVRRNVRIFAESWYGGLAE